MNDLIVNFRDKPLRLSLSEAKELLADLKVEVREAENGSDQLRPPISEPNGQLSKFHIYKFLSQVADDESTLQTRTNTLFSAIVRLGIGWGDEVVDFDVVCRRCGLNAREACAITGRSHFFDSESVYDVGVESLKQQYETFMNGQWTYVGYSIRRDMALLVERLP